MNIKEFKDSYIVLTSANLEELAENLTNVANDSWNITVLKTTKEDDKYKALVKKTDEITQEKDNG